MGPGDINRAYENCSLFWKMNNARADLTAYLSDPGCILLAADVDGEPAGQIVGYILKRWDTVRPMLFLYSIDVDVNYRRRGIARALIHEFLDIGRVSGCDRSFVITNEGNVPAMKLYETLGGTRVHSDDVMMCWRF